MSAVAVFVELVGVSVGGKSRVVLVGGRLCCRDEVVEVRVTLAK